MRLRHYLSFEGRTSRGGSTLDLKADVPTVTVKKSRSRLRHDSAQSSASGIKFIPELLPSDRLTTHRLPKHSIPAFIDNESLPLQLPPLSQTPSSIEVSPTPLDINELSQAHFQAFQPPKRTPSTTDSRSGPWTIELATKQVRILRKAFPKIHSRPALLSMAAWFHLLCFTDDETEKMSAYESQLAMKHCIGILKAASRMKAAISGNSAPIINSVQHTKILYHLRAASRLPSGHTVASATLLFVRHAQRLLGVEGLQRVAVKIIKVFQALADENTWREEGSVQSLDPEEYTRLRSSTVGLAPFWAILRETLFSSTAADISAAETATLGLESHVAATVRLQNDLVGAVKDLLSGDPMNYILRLMEREAMSTEQGVEKAVEVHNWRVREAEEERRRAMTMTMGEGPMGEGMRVYVESLVEFQTTHFLWASGAGRYKTA